MNKKSRSRKVTNPSPRFWIAIIGVGAVVLWYMFVVLGSLVVSRFIAGLEPDQPDAYYGIATALQTALPLLAAMCVAPFVYVALRRVSTTQLLVRTAAIAAFPPTTLYLFGIILELFPSITAPSMGWYLAGAFVLAAVFAAAWAVWIMVRIGRTKVNQWVTGAVAALPAVVSLIFLAAMMAR